MRPWPLAASASARDERGSACNDAPTTAEGAALNGTAPRLLGFAHFDQLGSKGQVAFWQAQVVSQLRAKALKLHRQVRAGALAHGVVFGLGLGQVLVGVVGLGNGVFSAGLQLGLACVHLLHRRLGLGLVVAQLFGTRMLSQPQVAHQRLVLRQLGLYARQLLACMLDVLLQRFDAGTTRLQVQAVQVLLVLACGVDLLLG